MSVVDDIAPAVGVRAACAALWASRATYYRRRKPREVRPRMRSPRALSVEERADILAILYSERFMDASPSQVHCTLADESVVLGSVSTMYRILRSVNGSRERRAVRRHPSFAQPELVARAPNQVWSWDITKIPGPHRRTWYHLYVIIDIFSRKIVGWRIEEQETGELAKAMMADAMEREQVKPGTLTLHADRGTSMRSSTVSEFLTDIQVARSHSRPRVSNDNAFSEANFKTMKYSPHFPARFISLAEARQFMPLWISWYNHEHHHSGIAGFTPATVHDGLVEQAHAVRQAAMDAAYALHPERFVSGRPTVDRPPQEVWINRPTGRIVDVHPGSEA